MAQGTRICKICGKEYPYCKSFAPAGVFRWQDVACCAEHGAQYFAEIEASRSGKTIKVEQPAKEADKKTDKKGDKKTDKKCDDRDSEGFQPKED